MPKQGFRPRRTARKATSTTRQTSARQPTVDSQTPKSEKIKKRKLNKSSRGGAAQQGSTTAAKAPPAPEADGFDSGVSQEISWWMPTDLRKALGIPVAEAAGDQGMDGGMMGPGSEGWR